jgi:hypothetical protein
MTDDPIQQARALISDSIDLFVRDCQTKEGDEPLRAALYYLMKLEEKSKAVCGYAEKWQAIAIEERAYILSCNVLESHGIDEFYRAQAAASLALEASNWHKISPEEQKAIREAIYAMTDDDWDYGKELAVLRKLL